MLTRRTLLFAALALAPSGAFAATFELEPGITVLEPLSHGTLSVYPLVQTARAVVPSDKYLSLKQGVSKGVVTVSEMPNGGDVNRLQVKNTSAQPLLLLSGEIVLGGKQDRVTSTDTVVEANSTRVVAVFCVEHGRWNGQAAFGGTGGFAEGKLRRLARYEKDQSGVWNHVAKKTAALKASINQLDIMQLEVANFDPDLTAHLTALPAVENVATHYLCTDSAWSVALHTTDSRGMLPLLIDAIGAKAGQIRHMQIAQPTLEDVFISLTGKQLRE